MGKLILVVGTPADSKMCALNPPKFIDLDVKLLGGDKERNVLASPIAIAMPNPTKGHRGHFLRLPVEIHLEILGQLVEFQGGRTLVMHRRLLKNIRLVCKTLANLAAIYLFRDVRVGAHTQPGPYADLFSRSLGHHVRSLFFETNAPRSYTAQLLPNLPNIRYLILECHAWETVKTVADSAIINAMAKLQHLEWVDFAGKGYEPIDETYSPPSPTFFDTTFNGIISSHAEQLTSISLELCPFHCAPGSFQLLRENAKNLHDLSLTASLPASLWPVFSQPVIWACADRLITLEIMEIHGMYVPTLVEHIASGIFGNLKQLLIDQDHAVRDRRIAIPDIKWNIRPLDVLTLTQIPRLELKVFGCLHAKDVYVGGIPRHAMIELVQGGRFKEMAVLRIWKREWKHIELKELTSACANRNTELLFE